MKLPDRNTLKNHLTPGCLYGRVELGIKLGATNIEVLKLLKAGLLVNLGHGIYEFPNTSRFGLLPPDPNKLIEFFLKTAEFLVFSLNDYNALGIGTTQLYNHLIVYNHKRSGRVELGHQVFEFRKRTYFPKLVTPEFLLKELTACLPDMAEDRAAVLANARARLAELQSQRTIEMATDDLGPNVF
jgi:hypothetical protein